MTFILYIFLINVVAFFLFCNDKHRAVFFKRRIPEFWLFATAVVGGSFGAYMAMLFFRHKTGKPLFRIGVPVLLGLLCVIMFFLGYPLNILPDVNL